MMDPVKLFVETGKKRVFAGAIDWPGWCRAARDEEQALETLFQVAPRYARATLAVNLGFRATSGALAYTVVERHEGNRTTDFGAPAVILDGDATPMEPAELAHLKGCLSACWAAFDNALAQAEGRELRKGPRGGGRDTGKIIEHVLSADGAYLRKLAWKFKRTAGLAAAEALGQTRAAIDEALDSAVSQGLPEHGPRGGALWPPRYFVRRVGWHVLDHAWEIEDRLL